MLCGALPTYSPDATAQLPIKALLFNTLISYTVFSCAAKSSKPRIDAGIAVVVAVFPDVNSTDQAPVAGGFVMVNEFNSPH